MIVQLNAVVIDADASNRQEMSNFLANHGVVVVAQLPAVEGLPALLARPDAPHLVVLNLDPSPHDSLKRAGVLVKQFPQTSFFVMSQLMDPMLLMEAMHLGVKEFVPLPIIPEKFAAGIERVAAMNGMGKRATIVHAIPTQGGCGSTTVACNLAASFARKGKTVLVDLDLVRGAAATSFDVHPRYTIADVMDSSGADPALLANALAVHTPSGLAILARPEQPEDSHRVQPQGFSRLLGVLSRMYDYVVIDSLMSADPLYAAAIQAADVNLLVTQLNVPSVKNAERFMGAMRRMGIEASRIRIVVNRYVKKGWDIAPEEVERTLGLQIAWLIPNDFKNAIAAINFGEPVVIRTPKTEMSVSLFGLTESLLPRAA